MAVMQRGFEPRPAAWDLTTGLIEQLSDSNRMTHGHRAGSGATGLAQPLTEPTASHFRSYTTCSVYFPWILLMEETQPGVCKEGEEVLHSTEKCLAVC